MIAVPTCFGATRTHAHTVETSDSQLYKCYSVSLVVIVTPHVRDILPVLLYCSSVCVDMCVWVCSKVYVCVCPCVCVVCV